MPGGGGEGTRTDRAFERLYRRHVADVHRYASAVLANPADAEDVTQSVFLNAYRAYQGGSRPEQPLNWLIAITHNVCRQRFREGARRPREVVLDEDLASGPEDERDDRYRQEDILRALSQLSLNQRAALAMRELEGRSYGEIASILGTTKAAVETLIFRARRAFREQLEGSLTCNEAERAISLQLDGLLDRRGRGSLRAHLRSCPECASLARRFRAQRSALRGFAFVPLPQSLAGGFGVTGGAAVGTALGVKAVALGAAALVAAGVGTELAVKHSPVKSAPLPAKQRPSSGTLPATSRARPDGGGAASGPAAARLASADSPVQRTHHAVRHRATGPVRHGGKVGAAASSTPAAPVTAQPVASAAEEASARTSAAVRQQPQLSGGGPHHQGPQGLGRAAHRPAAQSGAPTNPAASAAHGRNQHSAKPDHPAKPDHSKKPDHHAKLGHPTPNDESGGGPPEQPTTTASQQPEPPTSDVPASAVPEPPAAPAPTPPAGQPPVNVPNRGPEPQVKPPGKPQDVVPPRKR